MAETPRSNTCTRQQKQNYRINQCTRSWPQVSEISPTEMHQRELVRSPARPYRTYCHDYRVDIWSWSRLQSRRDCTWLVWCAARWRYCNMSV